MRYVLLVSHGTMAPGVHSVLRMLLGERDNVLSYSMEDGVSADAFMEGLKNVIAPIGEEDSVVVLGDIVGGSPLTNTLNVLTQKGLLAKTIALGGLSLPMAISTLMAVDDGVDDEALVENVIQEARDGVRQVVLELSDDEDEDL
ncbi:MAG: PTS fructose transporter subunit IIA [Olsenella sp.]|nr:PTS fructose transporter subunit IIA [Olsenella sp.]